MTMSVGLGRIINDPKASVIVRKALGTLSTPELIVTDEGVTINDDGKIAIKLNPNGGLAQDADGLSVGVANTGITGSTIGHPVVTGFVGVQVNLELPKFINPIDTWSYYAGDAQSGLGSSVTNFYGYYVDAMTEGTDLNAAFCGNVQSATDAWNVYMIGTAANYFAGSVSIGTEDITAKLCVEATTEQFRLRYDATNYISMTVSSTGTTTIQGFGSAAGITVTAPTVTMTGGTGGLRLTGGAGGLIINSSTPIKRFVVTSTTFSVGAGSAFADTVLFVPGVFNGDAVMVVPTTMPTSDMISWFGVCTADNTVTIRIRFDPTSGASYFMGFHIWAWGI